jgi:Ca2+-binding RTX toxin-like protein
MHRKRILALLAAAPLALSPILITGTAAATSERADSVAYYCLGKRATKVGSNAGETIHGTRGNDVIVARGGNDTIFGYSGSDYICAGNGHDRVYAGRGHDYVDAFWGDDRVWGEDGNDNLYGGEGDDTMQGGYGNDYLRDWARYDVDYLFGNWGFDRLDTRDYDNDDTLNGGLDVDDCSYNFADNATSC